MPLDPQAQALLEAGAGATPVELMSIEEGRAALEERVRLTGGQPSPVERVYDTSADGPAGPVRVRVYHPRPAQRLPGVVFIHGGGWVRGSLQTHDIACRALANAAECVVVSVDYRMAPEHKFPAAIDDSFAATRWVAEHAADLGIDASRLAVAGDSAGGQLAAAVALLARASDGPRLACQILIYPVTDHNLDTRSYVSNATGYGLTREAMRFYWQHYLRSDADGDDPRASPLRASDLSGLPPALVITAEYDPLCDEGRAYADRLRDAGVPVTYSEYAGLTHGFVTSMGAIDRGHDAVREMAGALRSAFAAVPA
jgi:acetyl esterase